MSKEINLWSRRFSYAALYHLLIASVVTSLVAVEGLQIPRIIAGGHAGMWYTVGYFMYIIIGFLGMLGFSYLYAQSKVETNANVWLAWINFVLLNIGVMAASYQLMYAGYISGYMEHVLKSNLGSIHHFLVNFVEPIGISVLVACIGAFSGIINLVILYIKKK